MKAQIQGWFEHATTNAILLKVSGRSTWIPKSQISYKRTEPRGSLHGVKVVTVNVPIWFAEKNGIEYEEVA